MPDDVRLIIKIDNSKPVELMDLTRGLLGLADEYASFIADSGYIGGPDEIKLYIKEIKSGSIEAELVALAPGLLALVNHPMTVLGYARFLSETYDFLTGKSPANPVTNRTTYENASAFVEPIAKDSASQLNLSVVNNGNVEFHYHLDSAGANVAQNAARRELARKRETVTGLHDKVLLYWYQTRGDIKSKAGDKAIVESLWDRPVKAIFEDASIKEKILSSPENLFNLAYIVDLEVGTVDGQPAVYKITRLHEIIERPLNPTVPQSPPNPKHAD